MVRFTVLGSGSKGNSTVIAGGRTRLLVDAGLSCRELFRRMRLAGEEPESLDAILITHEHSDHVAGVAVTARKLGIPVYFTEGTHRAWKRWLEPKRTLSRAEWLDQCRRQQQEREQAELRIAAEAAEEAETQIETSDLLPQTPEGCAAPSRADQPAWLPAVEYFEPGKAFQIGDIEVSPFTIPHDAADPCGFVFRAEGVRLGVATDLGYMPPNVKHELRGLDLMLIESNHDLDMLRDGPYPWAVKQRVLSRVGHLSNEATAQFLAEDYDGHAAYVILGHLSENNNHPDLARLAAERALAHRASLLANRLILASQGEPLEAIDF